MPRSPLSPHAAGRSGTIPSFALYGEADASAPELFHIEEIRQRSSLYQWEIDPHVHRALYQIIWVGSGDAQVTLDELQEALAGPGAVIIPPGVVHGFRFAPDTRGMVLTLNARFLAEGELRTLGEPLQALFATPRLITLTPPAHTGSHPAGTAATPQRSREDDTHIQRLEGLLTQLGREFEHGSDAHDAPVTRWLAQATVWRLAQACARSASAASGKRARHHQAMYARFLALVEDHYHEHWPLARYADQLGLSTPSLNRLARAASGRPALELIHERLTREACRRLVFLVAPVATIAHDLGFEDPAYFSRFFKRRTGLSPGAFRERHGG